MINHGFEWISRVLFIMIALALYALSIAMVIAGSWELIQGSVSGIVIYNLMSGVGLLVVSLAIADVAKFVVEENVVGDHELRSPGEARRSMTKFMTIIIIALSLEAIVGIFEAAREKTFSDLLYPAVVMAVAVLALVGLGAFQFLSRRAQAAPISRDADAPPES